MHVTLHGREQHGAGFRRRSVFAFCLDERREIRNCLLHHPGRLDHLREEHLAGAEEVADGVHPAHERPLDHVDGTIGAGASFLDVGFDEHGDAVDQRVVDATLDIPRPPLGGGGVHGLGPVACEPGSRVEESFGRVVAPREHDVLAQLAQFGVDLVVYSELTGVDDAHPHTGFDSPEQEHRVHCFANRFVPAEREREVRDTPGDVDEWQLVGDRLGGLEEVEAIAVVFLDASGDGKDVRVDDDVVGREADLVDQEVVRPPGDVDLAFDGVGLADLVERHHDHCGAVVETRASLGQECCFALLHRDRVHDRLALHALQARFDDLELRRVDHDRHTGDVGLRRDQVEERRHGLHAVDQAVVHVDVDDLGAALHLLQRHFERLAVLVVLDQPAEPGRAGDVGALADVDERDVVGERERLQPGQLQSRPASRNETRRRARDCAGDRTDVRRRRAAAPTDDVEQTGFGELVDEGRGLFGPLVVAAELVGESSVRIGADQGVGDRRELEQVRSHLLCAERTVQSDGQWLSMANRLPERGRCLPRQGATRAIGDRSRDQQRQLCAVRMHRTASGDDRCLRVERVEDRLDQDRVDTASEQRLDLFLVRVSERTEGDGAVAGILDLRRQRQGHVRRADGTSNEARATIDAVRLLGSFAGEASGDLVQFDDLVDGVVVTLRHAVGRERVGLDDVGTCQEVVEMDPAHRVGLRDREQLVVAAEVAAVVTEPVAPKGLVGQPERLDLGAHGTVEHDDALTSDLRDRVIVERMVRSGHATSLWAFSAMACVRCVASQTVTVRPSCPTGGATSMIVGQSNPD